MKGYVLGHHFLVYIFAFLKLSSFRIIRHEMSIVIWLALHCILYAALEHAGIQHRFRGTDRKQLDFDIAVLMLFRPISMHVKLISELGLVLIAAAAILLRQFAAGPADLRAPFHQPRRFHPAHGFPTKRITAMMKFMTTGSGFSLRLCLSQLLPYTETILLGLGNPYFQRPRITGPWTPILQGARPL